MSQNTPNLDLPYLAAAQAQKHVTVNEAIRAIDAIVQIGVIDRDLSTPPAEPNDGDRYIVAAAATGEWLGKEGSIAAWQDGAWLFYSPQQGWTAWVADEATLAVWDGSDWAAIETGESATVNPTPQVGINTTADATNRLAVKSDAILMSHDDETPGTGDMQLKLNKAADANTTSLLFQTAYGGRAEMGTTGDDDFRIKVSADGAVWRDALVVNRNDGSVALPNTVLSGGAGGVQVSDEGAHVVTAGRLNFVGAGVAATDGGNGEATISIPGAGSTGATGGIANATPAYSEPGGQGDRRDAITVSNSDGILQLTQFPYLSTSQNLVSGDDGTSDVTNHSVRFAYSAPVAGHWVSFDFGPGARRVITEATWRQNNDGSLGFWRWQGGNDGATWVDIGPSFELGAATTQVQASLANNITPYRFYRLFGVSGSTTAVAHIYEVMFKIGADAFEGIALPPGGEIGQVVVKAGAGDGVASWGQDRTVSQTYAAGLLAEYYFDEGGGTSVSDIRGPNHGAIDASVGNASWSAQGVTLTGGAQFATPPLAAGRTMVLVYRVPLDEGDSQRIVAASNGSLPRVLKTQRATSSDVEALHVGRGGGVISVPRTPTLFNTNVPYALTRGGWQVVFVQFPSNGTPRFGVAGTPGSPSASTAPTQLDLAYAAVYDTTLDDAARSRIYDAARQIMVRRGVFLDWRDCPRTVDAVILAGQSNADGRALIADLSAADQATRFRHAWVTSGNGRLPMELALGQGHSTSASQFGPEVGAALAQEAALSGRLAICKAALGSTWLAPSTVSGVSDTTSWNVAEDLTRGLTHTLLLRRWWEFQARWLEMGVGPRLRAVWWMQGENDAGATAQSANYQASLQALWDHVKAHAGDDALAQMVVARIRDADPNYNATAVAEVRAAQSAFASVNSDATMIDTDAMSLGADNEHFDAAGMKALGAAFRTATAGL